MKKILIFSTFALLLFVSSCTMQNKTISGAPIEARVNFVSSDLEYVGDVTGSATQYYVLGIPYGGRKYHTASTGGLLSAVNFDRAYNNALYDALSQKSDADFVLPLSSESTTEYSFLGKKVTLKVRAKAFKIKAK
ncbi:MAG: hypothetical protein NTX97_14275 [Bacteroidetes bacterium]|nr:hypothetical protein [Bacteroidota bacterium]